MTKHELLKYAVSKGIIDLSALETQVEDMERKRYLEMHRFKVWKDSKGYWITHLPDEKRTLLNLGVILAFQTVYVLGNLQV